MRIVPKIAALLLMLVIAPCASAQIVIKPGLPNPGKFTSKLTLDIAQTLNLAGQELTTGQKRELITNNQVSQPAADGSITVVETFQSLKDTTTLPGGATLKFDSAEGPKPQGTAADFLVDVMAVMAKTKTTIVFDKSGKAIRVNATADGLDELDEPGKSLLQADLDPQRLKDIANAQRDEYHAEPVKPGEQWKKETSTDLGQGAKFTHTAATKYVGVENRNGVNLHKVTISYSDVNFEQNASAPGAPSIAGTEMEVIDGGSTYFFDAEKQQVVDSNFKLHVKGKITLSVQGMEIPAEIEISISRSVKID